MNKAEKERMRDFREHLEYIQMRVNSMLDDLIARADEVEAHVMKKTTQRSPEFHGGANC